MRKSPAKFDSARIREGWQARTRCTSSEPEWVGIELHFEVTSFAKARRSSIRHGFASLAAVNSGAAGRS